MARTQTDLIVRVLDLLGVTQVGQDPSAEDAEKVSDFIAGKVQDLQDRRVAVVTPTAILDAYFEPFAKIVANAAGPAFGVEYDEGLDAREEDRLRLNQVPQGGEFTRRRAAPLAEADVARAVERGPAFAGEAQRAVDRSATFTGETSRALRDGSTFAAETPRAVNQASTFTGETPRGLAREPTFAGDRPRAVR